MGEKLVPLGHERWLDFATAQSRGAGNPQNNIVMYSQGGRAEQREGKRGWSRHTLPDAAATERRARRSKRGRV